MAITYSGEENAHGTYVYLYFICKFKSFMWHLKKGLSYIMLHNVFMFKGVPDVEMTPLVPRHMDHTLPDLPSTQHTRRRTPTSTVSRPPSCSSPDQTIVSESEESNTPNENRRRSERSLSKKGSGSTVKKSSNPTYSSYVRPRSVAAFDTQTSEGGNSDTLVSSQTYFNISDSENDSTRNNDDNEISTLHDELSRIQERIKRKEVLNEEKKRKQKEADEMKRKKEAEKKQQSASLLQMKVVGLNGMV